MATKTQQMTPKIPIEVNKDPKNTTNGTKYPTDGTKNTKNDPKTPIEVNKNPKNPTNDTKKPTKWQQKRNRS